MPDTTLVLGDFKFAGPEIPSQISVGGTQQLVVHEFIGGIRVIDAMGRRDRALEWSGWFMGKSAQSRSDYLDAYRVGGKAQPLTWAQYNYSVVVREFEAIFRREFEINYRILCEVVADNTTVSPGAAAVNIDTAIQNDQTTMNALGTWS